MAYDFIDQTRLKKLRLQIDSDDTLYSGMKKLKIRGKNLEHLPLEIFSITELEVLDLSPERESCIHYHITELPARIGKLINLRVLMLDTNELREIPPEIGRLKNLEKFSLSNNLLKSLPDGFERLVNLKSLHCANNHFDHFPGQVCELEKLEFVDFSGNQITELPESIGQLQKLESLLLFINQLSRLPDTICKLVNLHCLWLGNNQIEELPRNFGKLVNLDWGCQQHTFSCVMDGNPLTLPPTDVCKRGPEAIALYFDHYSRKHFQNTAT